MTTMFDATIDLVPGITGGRSVSPHDLDAVRDAVAALPESGWVSVDAAGGVPDHCEWLTVYECGKAIVASGPGIDEQKRRIEAAVRVALRASR